MGRDEKAIARLLSKPKDYHYNEAKSLLQRLGFIENNKGRTSGSRVQFVRGEDTILLHRPHPTGELKTYQVKQLIDTLQQLNLI